jgi:dephospho-CoA kinase
VVIAIAGSIGSGKTHLAQALADELGFTKAGFGTFLRHLAQTQSLEPSREALQELGEMLATNDPVSFVRDVLAFAGWKGSETLLLEGVRHTEILSALRSVVKPIQVKLVFIETPDEIRHSRIVQRDGVQQEHIEQLESHSTETQATQLRATSDVVFDGSMPTHQLVQVVCTWLSQLDT